MSDASHEPPQISLKDLRENLKEALRKSGALNSVKANIRKEFINTLSSHKKPNDHKNVDTTLQTRIIMSLIYQHFKSIGMTHSLSVFVAECGYETQGFLSEEDLIDVLKITNSSSNVRKIHPQTPLELLVEVHAKTNKHQIDASMQTDLSGPGIREVLDNQIKELHLNFLTRRETERLLPNKTIEERMISYQRECEERVRREYEAQLNHIRTVEISAVKHDEALKMRLQLEQIRTELEQSYQQRLAIYDEKENHQKQALLDSERRIQQLEYESRQRIQRELDEIRTREEATRRKNEMELQTTRLLETRLKEMQAVIESREREVGRREKELELKQSEIVAVAHEEARLSVENQLENLLREKASLMIERKRFEDEKANDASLRLAISEMRAKHREMENEIANKEDEITTLKSTLSRLQNTLLAEDKDVSKLLESCGWRQPLDSASEQQDVPSLNSLGLGVGGKMDGIVLLIRKNIQLEGNVAQLQRDLKNEAEATLKERKICEDLSKSLEICRKELDDMRAAKNEINLQHSRVLSDMGKLKKHILKLRQNLEDSKKEKEDLEQLVSEQRNVIGKLRLKFSNPQQSSIQYSSTASPDLHATPASYQQGAAIPIPHGWATRPINYYGEIQPGFEFNPHLHPPIPPSNTLKPPEQVVQTMSPPQVRVNDLQEYPPRQSVVPPPAVVVSYSPQEPPLQPRVSSTSAIVEEEPPVISKIEFNEIEIDRIRQRELEKEREREKELEQMRARERIREQERREQEERDKKHRDEILRREREDREKREMEDKERREREDRERKERWEKEDRERREKEEADRRERQRIEEENQLRVEREREEQRIKAEREAEERRQREERERKEREQEEKRDREEREKREQLEREAEEKRIRLEKEKEEKFRVENAEKLEAQRRKEEAEKEAERKKEEDARALQEARARVLARRQQQQKNKQVEAMTTPEPSRLPSPRKPAASKYDDLEHSPASSEDDAERSIGLDDNSDYSW